MGPQQREFQIEIRQTKQVGVGAQQREFHIEIQQTKQVGVGAPTKRISDRNSTDKASWGWRMTM